LDYHEIGVRKKEYERDENMFKPRIVQRDKYLADAKLHSHK